MTIEMERRNDLKEMMRNLSKLTQVNPHQPPFAGAGRIKIKKRPPRKVVLPISNPTQAVPSPQPTGVPVPGQHGSGMPNTSLVPASLAPTRGQYTRGRQTSSGQY